MSLAGARIRNEVLRLYQAELLSMVATLLALSRRFRALEHYVPHRTKHACSKGYDEEGG